MILLLAKKMFDIMEFIVCILFIAESHKWAELTPPLVQGPPIDAGFVVLHIEAVEASVNTC